MIPCVLCNHAAGERVRAVLSASRVRERAGRQRLLNMLASQLHPPVIVLTRNIAAQRVSVVQLPVSMDEAVTNAFGLAVRRLPLTCSI